MERAKIEELKTSWTAPAALKQSRPREVRITRQGITLRVWSVLILFGGPLGMLFLAQRLIETDSQHPERPSKAWILAIPGAVLGAAGGLMQMSIVRQRQLLEDGRVAPGVISSFTNIRESRIAHYEFILLNGAVIKGRCQAGKKLPAAGGTITVVYDADNPKRNAAYPLAFWQVG